VLYRANSNFRATWRGTENEKNNKYMNQEKNKTTGTKPPYGLGYLGLFPFVGFFVGIGLTFYGIVKYKDKKLTIIGIACMLFSVVVYASIYYIGFKSEAGRRGWETHAQMQLNTLVRHIEFFKLENGHFPDSLPQLGVPFIWDPIQPIRSGRNRQFNFKNLGDRYLLFSSGRDGIPNTDDDIFPEVNPNSKNIGWVRNP